MNIDLSDQHWNSRYLDNNIGWDIGYPSPAIINFLQTQPKDSRILIPGCGHAYEGEALHKMGFTNITLLDFASTSKDNFCKRVPTFDPNQFHVGDFFKLDHHHKFDFLVEQTFFCALNPTLRSDYITKMHQILAMEGKLVGLLFDAPKFTERPPFGGCKEDYQQLFEKAFTNVKITPCNESIKPRMGTEVFIEIGK